MNREKKKLEECFCKETINDEILAKANALLVTKCANLQQENKQLKNNWNKLKKIVKSQSDFKKRANFKGGLWFEVDELLDKMQELEQGSGSDE